MHAVQRENKTGSRGDVFLPGEISSPQLAGHSGSLLARFPPTQKSISQAPSVSFRFPDW